MELAVENAMTEWPNGGMPFPKQDIKNPEDFAAMAKLVHPDDFKNDGFVRMLTNAVFWTVKRDVPAK